MPSLPTVLRSLRPPFLILTPACLLVGLAVAWQSDAAILISDCLLVLIGGLAAHAAVNLLNEYVDFRCGLDASTERTPFSGGSGALVENPAAAPAVLMTAGLCLLISVAVGGVFLVERGLALLPIGLLGLLIVLSYTPWLNRSALACLIAPGLGFGPAMVLGTEVALTGVWSAGGLFASLLPFFLVNNLLLLNQLPDIDADRRAGRAHFPIRFGIAASLHVFLLFWLLAVFVLTGAVLSGLFPALALITLLPMLVGLLAFVEARAQLSDNIGKRSFGQRLIPALGKNVLAAVGSPVFLGASLLLGY